MLGQVHTFYDTKGPGPNSIQSFNKTVINRRSRNRSTVTINLGQINLKSVMSHLTLNKALIPSPMTNLSTADDTSDAADGAAGQLSEAVGVPGVWCSVVRVCIDGYDTTTDTKPIRIALRGKP